MPLHPSTNTPNRPVTRFPTKIKPYVASMECLRTGGNLDYESCCLEIHANACVTQPVTHLTVIQQNKDMNDFNEDLNGGKLEFFPVFYNSWYHMCRCLG